MRHIPATHESRGRRTHAAHGYLHPAERRRPRLPPPGPVLRGEGRPSPSSTNGSSPSRSTSRRSSARGVGPWIPPRTSSASGTGLNEGQRQRHHRFATGVSGSAGCPRPQNAGGSMEGTDRNAEGDPQRSVKARRMPPQRRVETRALHTRPAPRPGLSWNELSSSRARSRSRCLTASSLRCSSEPIIARRMSLSCTSASARICRRTASRLSPCASRCRLQAHSIRGVRFLQGGMFVHSGNPRVRAVASATLARPDTVRAAPLPREGRLAKEAQAAWGTTIETEPRRRSASIASESPSASKQIASTTGSPGSMAAK